MHAVLFATDIVWEYMPEDAYRCYFSIANAVPLMPEIAYSSFGALI